MRIHRIVTTILAGAALVAGIALAPSPAFAGHKHHKGCGHHHDDDEYYDGHHGHGYGHRYDDEHYDDEYYDGPRYSRYSSFVVPDRIVYADLAYYRPYYERRVYHGPHRHYHALYAFPVQTHHGVVYRQVPYCHGPQGYVAFAGPRFAVQVGF